MKPSIITVTSADESDVDITEAVEKSAGTYIPCWFLKSSPLFNLPSNCPERSAKTHFIMKKGPWKFRVARHINPLTPGMFCKKCVFWTFWWFLGCISAKLPLIRSKMHLRHNSLPFLPPASRFSALWLGHAQKSKFWEEKVTYVFRLLDFWHFFFAFPFSSFLFFLLQWLTFYWACLRLKNFWESVIETGIFFSMEQPGVVAGNFALSFSLNFLSIFVHI